MTIYIKYFLLTIIFISFCYSQPKINIVDGTKLDLGNMISGDKKDKKVTIENVGKDTLIIENVQASCGCTAALLSEKIIPPGKKGTLSIGFDSKNFDGKIHKTVTITSNDTTNSPLVISFSADVITLLKFEPKFIYLQNMKMDSIATVKVVVTNNTEEAIDITSLDTKVPGLKIEIMQRKLMPQQSTELSAIYTAVSEGMAQGEITFNTNNKKQPKIPMRFYAFVKN